MESFLEGAPQMVLQIYIMIITVQTPLITGLYTSRINSNACFFERAILLSIKLYLARENGDLL